MMRMLKLMLLWCGFGVVLPWWVNHFLYPAYSLSSYPESSLKSDLSSLMIFFYFLDFIKKYSLKVFFFFQESGLLIINFANNYHLRKTRWVFFIWEREEKMNSIFIGFISPPFIFSPKTIMMARVLDERDGK